MPAKKKDDKEVTVVAELECRDANGRTETVRTFDKAWHTVLLMPTPATMSFVKWARKN